MKNIHLLPTPNPSRLHLWTDENGTRPSLCELKYSHTRNTQSIYITNDEEIKEGDYVLALDTNIIFKCNKYEADQPIKQFKSIYKKIILTTDQDLIKDGVQAIDDEFLEWFVKNPSCESVETERLEDGQYVDRFADGSVIVGIYENYKIIIPKVEESNYNGKQEIKWISENQNCKQIDSCYNSLSKKCICPKEEPKQETLEEVSERLYPTTIDSFTDTGIDMSETERLIFTDGAKWQKEQDNKLYSDKEVKHLMTLAFEQGFKKADVVEAGLEAKETDTEVNWIFLKHKK